ncbi:Hypothetical protein AA314_05822 [Archangium gephyra]|uniref:Uncharacterized protein n=1 Tax=Archangium gephyra TaxID=48 RepID=A0AAC8QB27_9BACT|nr:Hypothetical protein AA314_05822 [Archangium gephyra]
MRSPAQKREVRPADQLGVHARHPTEQPFRRKVRPGRYVRSTRRVTSLGKWDPPA